MKEKLKQGQIILPTDKKLWKIYHNLGQFVTKLDRLPDAQEAINAKRSSAPPDLIHMLF